MDKRVSTFIKATLEHEDWLPPLAEREGADKAEVRELLATAALTRGTGQATPVPEGAEEASRLNGVAHLTRMHMERGASPDSAESDKNRNWLGKVGDVLDGVIKGLGKRS